MADPTKPHLFQSGNRANPGGRPRGLAKLIREHIGEPGIKEILDELFAIALHDPDGKTKVAAAKVIFEHCYGKPAQAIEVTSDGPTALLDMLGLTPAQRERRRELAEAEEAPPDGADT